MRPRSYVASLCTVMDRIGLAIHDSFETHGAQKAQFTGCGVLFCSKLLIARASAAKKGIIRLGCLLSPVRSAILVSLTLMLMDQR